MTSQAMVKLADWLDSEAAKYAGAEIVYSGTNVSNIIATLATCVRLDARLAAAPAASAYETDDELAEQIHRVAGCQVGSERTKNIIEWFRSKSIAAPAASFDPTNHHNALKCPYCNPDGLSFAPAASLVIQPIDCAGTRGALKEAIESHKSMFPAASGGVRELESRLHESEVRAAAYCDSLKAVTEECEKLEAKLAELAAPPLPADDDLGDLTKHGMNCSWYGSHSDNECTCSLKYRIAISTERTMHRAWRKRAEEAEAAPLPADVETEARIAILEKAVRSIAANTCCDNCREAALVARSALASYVGLARTPLPADGVRKEEPRRIEVDIAAAFEALQDSPELCAMMNEMVGGPALIKAQAEIERLRSVIGDCANIALAIDSGRGNEKEIAKAIQRLASPHEQGEG